MEMELLKMSKKGWIKLHRKIEDNGLWLLEKFTKGQAWIDLVMLANHERGFAKTKNGAMNEIQRGECGWSELSLSKRWIWSRGKVKRFVVYLTVQQMIQQKIVSNQSIITILNYEEYQTDNKQDNKQDTNKNNKELKNEKKKKESLSGDKPKNQKSTFSEYYPKILEIWNDIQTEWNLSGPKGNKAAEKSINRYLREAKDGERALRALEGLLINEPSKWHTSKKKVWKLEWFFRLKDSNSNYVDRVQSLLDGEFFEENQTTFKKDLPETNNIFAQMVASGELDE